MKASIPRHPTGGEAVKPLLITIDGPAGAGKTTVTRELAKQLSYTLVDTGALYRGIAAAAMDAGVPLDDETALESLFPTLRLSYIKTSEGPKLFLNDADITDRIRTPEISMAASRVSAQPTVRRYLLKLQRTLGQAKGVVFEGRDMGTVVFPDADIKFFLDADPKIRAARRFGELRQKTGAVSLDRVEKEMEIRDRNDSSRTVAPLKPAHDAIIIDATHLSALEVVERMTAEIAQKWGGISDGKHAPKDFA